jgi:glycosyltransferase involved in cell wall biosynthesis
MKVLAIPKGEIEGNSCQFMLYLEMERLGLQIDDYRYVNPFKNKYDLVHVHWPELFANGKTILHVFKKSNLFLRVLKYQKKKGANIIWTCHDVVSHNRQFPLVEKMLMKRFISMLDGVIAPLASSYQYACSHFPKLKGLPHTVIPTGHYINIYKNTFTKTDAREKLGIAADKKVIGFIGNISPYKGIFELLEVFTQLDDENTLLLLAGKPANRKVEEFIHKMSLKNGQVITFYGSIPNDEMQLYFNASDLIVLPFRKINNSGSLYMALGFGKHVLVPDFPQMCEVKNKYAADHVHLYTKGNLKETDLTQLLNKIKNGKADIKPDLSAMDYNILARQTASFFETLIN